MTKRLTESLQNIKTIKSFNAEQFEKDRVEKEVDNIFNLTYKSSRVNSISRPLMETLGGLAIAVIIYIGEVKLCQARLPQVLFLISYCIINGLSTNKVSCKFKCYITNGNGGASIFGIIDTKPFIIEEKNNKDSYLKNSTAYNIKFSDVTFAYESSKKSNLRKT